ncbi:cytochrome P450 [Cryptosporangium sp. NPDC051539]|uniref:cytochrome P450 n=1 Tax=Cryptosporangium sp. NPDC051539 TaxID=3363962 RepID=UPI0037B49655
MTSEAQATSDSRILGRDPIYDPLAPDVIADPFPFYRRLRDADPVYWHAQLDSWVVTGYDPCRQVLSDTTAFASDFRRSGEDVPSARLSIQSLDPPDHTAVRHLLVSVLRERSPAGLDASIAALMADTLAALPAGGATVDLVRDLARPVAFTTITAFLGVRLPAGPEFEEMSHAIVRSMDAGLDPGRATAGDQARSALSEIITRWLSDRSGAGFLAAAARQHEQGSGVPLPVLANSLRAVLHAGYESVSRLLGNVLGRLTADAPPWARTAVDAARLTDELLRLDGPVQADARVCVQDTLLGEHLVRRGDVLVLMLAAADRDPAVFPAPDAVDLTRGRGRHLAFGRGAHACLGAALGTQQLSALLTAVGETGTRFVPAGAPRHDDTATLRGLASLPVRLDRPAYPGGTGS